MEIGKASYGQERTERKSVKWLKLKDGANVFRIIPPIGSLAEKGVWARYLKIDWGFKDSRGINKPFQDCRLVNGKTKMVEVESAAHLYREKLKSEKERIVREFKAGTATKDQVAEINELNKIYNQDSKFYLNVVSSDGLIGVLKVPYKAKKALDEEIKKLNASGVDPLSVDDGRFFNFFRSGTMLETQYQVTVYKEKVETKEYGLVEKDVSHKLTNDLISRLKSEALDLSELDKMYPKLSSEDVQAIVDHGAKAVDEVFARVKPQREQIAAAQSSPAIKEEEEEPEAESTYTPPAKQAVEAKAPAKKAAPVKEEVDISQVSKAESDEDFLKKMGVI